MKISLYNQQAAKVGEAELNDKIFSVKPNLHLITESVRIQLSNSRQGGGHTKTRGDVRGGGKKPWRQKGTGRARAGSSRSPIWRGGGVTFGPTSDRNWSLKINKKAKTKALFMSLSDKVANNAFLVVDQIKLDTPKTKEFKKIWDSFSKEKLVAKKTLLVVASKDDSAIRASRNLKGITPIIASNLNIVDIMKADNLLVTKDAVEKIEKTFLKPAKS